MNAILAQAAALAAHAKARRLDAALGGGEAYWRQHSTFQFVRRLRFTARSGGLFRSSEVDLATTPPEWMASFPREAKVALMSLGASVPLEPHLASALVGGTKEYIAVLGSRNAAHWIPAWETVAQYPESRIWSVTYRMKKARGAEPPAKTLDEARKHLATALRDVVEFTSADPGLSVWRETFEKAEQSLDAREPVAPYHPDILPHDGYSVPARQLLAASVGAFVFGGMGSWNDLGVGDRQRQARYERLTRELYAAVMDGLLTAVNHGIPARLVPS